MDARVVGFPNPFKKPGKSDAKNDSSPSGKKPPTTNPPEKAEPPKSPSPSSPESPEDSSPDVSVVPIPSVLPPSWNPLLGTPKNNKNLTPPSPPSSTVTPANPGGEKRSPPSEQFSPPAPISASSDPKQQPNSNNPASVSGSSTYPILPPPQNPGVDPDPSPSSGGSGGGRVAPANQTAGPSRPHWALHPEMVVGFTLAAVCLVGLIALLMMALIRKTKKRAKSASFNHNPYVKSDGYYEGGSQKQPKEGNVSGSSHNKGGSMESPTVLGGVTFFSYEDLMEITNGFASQNLIGEGGFGCVFKGSLPSGRPVAVKQLKVGGRQGEKEFRAEVDIISRIHHRHLVSLVGYCISDKERILIYEFVPNNTLEHHLHGTPVLDWANRVKIALGAAKGLAYLHEDCSPKVIHRDIKSANILLDNSFEAKVADFGLAKLAIESKSHVSTRVMGTFGYMAPEYANSGKLTDRSDVFSFGVVLLELVTGRKPVDPTQPLGEESLVEWARPLLLHTIQTGDCGELVDPRLENHYEESKMIIMIEAAAACIRHSAPKRPRMVQVMRALDTDDGMSDLSNGLKYGQSITYDSGQYDEDILNFRMSRFDSSTGTNESLEQSCGAASSADFTSGESETRAFSSSFGHYQRSNSRGRQFK